MSTSSIELPKLDREHYLAIARRQGFSAAITALHHDKERWEYETFEGASGYQEALWKFLEEVRSFSRELWSMDLEERSRAPRSGPSV